VIHQIHIDFLVELHDLEMEKQRGKLGKKERRRNDKINLKNVEKNGKTFRIVAFFHDSNFFQ